MCLGLPFPLDAKCNCLPNTPLCLFRDGQIGDKPTSSPLRPGFAAVPLLWLLFGFVRSVLKRDVTAEDGWPLTSALLRRYLSTLCCCTSALFINLAWISSCNFFFFSGGKNKIFLAPKFAICEQRDSLLSHTFWMVIWYLVSWMRSHVSCDFFRPWSAVAARANCSAFKQRIFLESPTGTPIDASQWSHHQI